MNTLVFIQGLGVAGPFAARAFLPAFLTAALLRYGPRLPFVGESGVLDQLTGEPSWFTSDTALLVLGVLSVAELLADKSQHLRELLDTGRAHLSGALAALTYVGVLSATDAAFAKGAVAVTHAGVGDWLGAAFSGGAAWALGVARVRVLSVFSEADDGDATGLRRVWSWAEDLLVGAGILLALLFPFVMLVLLGLGAAVLFALQRWAEHVAERSKAPCPSCGTPVHRSALACPRCKTAVLQPRDLGWLGQPRPGPADVRTHAFTLVAQRRCRVCATRLRRGRQPCDACGDRWYEDGPFLDGLVETIDRRVPLTLGISVALGFIPVVGIVPAVLSYRMRLVAPFRAYLPFHRTLLARWVLGLLFFVLLAVQVIPGTGVVALPVMAVLSHRVHRALFLRHVRRATA